MAGTTPTTFSPTPDTLPKRFRGTLRNFKTIDSFFDFFSGIQVTDRRINGGRGSYKDVADTTSRDIERALRDRDTSWFGDPVPNSFEDAIERTRYQNMADFNDVYKNYIQPRIQDILRNSSADLEVPVMKYNDLGLGTFDFNKASAGLIPLYKYYSFKEKGYVDGILVETYQEGEKYKYKMITDGSPVALVPSVEDDDSQKVHKAYKEIFNGENPFEVFKKYGLRIGGSDAFTSTIKKSYVLKEKFPKPKNAVRIFVKLGENCNIRYPAYKWTGYAAIGIAELLDVLGYAVSIIGIEGINNNINFDGTLEYGTRFWGINLKRFEETLDKDSLLYFASDPSFFRIKVFDCIIKQAEYANDYIDASLGSSANKQTLENMIFNEYGKRDKLFSDKGKKNDNSQFLYYILSDIYSLEDLNTAILEIGLDVVNKNKEARERIFGQLNTAI